MSATTFSLGAHNLEDENGLPTFFADIIIFTEAIPKRIRSRAQERWEYGKLRAKARLRGYRIMVCKQQPDLVVAVRRRLFKVTGVSYTQYVDGRPLVTPNRGTFLVFARHRPTGRPTCIPAEHRINAAFPPFVRGEPKFRAEAWRRHTAGTLETIGRLKGSGFLVAAGGDLNTPHGESGYQGQLREVGTHFDRLGISAPAHIGQTKYLSNQGSDHPRIRAVVTLTKEK